MTPSKEKKKAVILFSGGLDSTTVLAFAKSQGYSCYCLSFRYGQKQTIELKKATQSARESQVAKHLILNLDLDKIGGSALTDAIDVPKDRDLEADKEGIPITYVPARNIIFLSHAIAWAEVLGASDIFIGVNAVDYSGYPDCRPNFLQAFTTMANLGTKAGVEKSSQFSIHAPLLSMSKAEIISLGISLGVDYSKTHSCYDPAGEKACGRCDACLLRLKGFAEAGIKDPASYMERDEKLKAEGGKRR
ncbi:MAG: 7-cyano-7-deazaguanine synthase QueC [Proteobacteria bacterium]|nr:7-cyano-7-deazaguanine synthase QueC [Pseudomonadota bacterium]MBU1234360.1 7-cyano-7-deazaguanine synthase QueC [Pseudomonadota bacterium]MBU1417155.1 7-cyano-7-deazaguanine synthase QueC [Pseudomonadota bacterium]MBU1456231.1 7-cyano-7-deazaguanine synthase QueC [Pseudomonadota bacterium]